MEKKYDIRKNKSLNEIKNLITIERLNDRLTIENIDYIYYNKAVIYGNKIEVEKTDLTSKYYDVFIYESENDLYISHITALNVRLNKQDIEID